MVAKALRIVDLVLVIAGIGAGCVAIAGFSEDADIMKNTYWSKLSAHYDDFEGTGKAAEFDAWANLWGFTFEFGGEFFEYFEDYIEFLAAEYGYEVDLDIDDLMEENFGFRNGEPTEEDYDKQDTMYALVIIAFATTALKMLCAIAVICLQNNACFGVVSSLLSLVGTFFWFAAVGVWVGKVMDDADDQDGFTLYYGPGLASACAVGGLLAISLLLSLIATVMGRNEPRKLAPSGAPEVVDAKDLETAATR